MTTEAQRPAVQQSADWKNTILAGLANYIDAGSIVAGAAALALWMEAYRMSNNLVGLIAALGPNAISAGIGALIGGRLCDLFGRKRIYQYDMLFYAFGMMWLVFAMNVWMVVIGFFLVGLAVGADIPASWSLIAEMAPDKQRGKHSGVAQILWYMGPVVVLLMFLVLTPLGLLGARIVFAHLAVLAIALTFLRSKMHESPRWVEAQSAVATGPDAAAEPKVRVRDLFTRQHIKSMAFLVGMYMFWNLWAGTNGFFFPYILRTVGDQSQATAVAVQTLSFLIGMLSIAFIFMRISDKVNQRTLFLVSAIIQVVGMALLAIFPLTLPLAIVHVLLMAIGQGFGAQCFFQLWSSELFPTLLRSTAQGVMFAVVRILLGIWS
ncbi:MAG: MFS transporter, partial [Sphingobium sp.]